MLVRVVCAGQLYNFLALTVQWFAALQCALHCSSHDLQRMLRLSSMVRSVCPHPAAPSSAPHALPGSLQWGELHGAGIIKSCT